MTKRKPHIVQTEKIDTSDMMDNDRMKYQLDEKGDPVQRRCVVCTGWFLVRRYQKDKKTCCARCTLCYEHGGPNYDYDVALKWKYEQQRKAYKEKTGYDNPGQNPEVKAKVNKTFDERYGDGTPGSGRAANTKNMLKNYKEQTGYDNPSQNEATKEKVRKTMAERYGDGNVHAAYVEMWRRKNATYKEKTGYVNAGQNPEVKAKVRKTVQERYGVDNVFQDEEIKKKIVDTNMKKYGVPYAHLQPERAEKIKQEMMDKYGVPYYVLLPEVQKKSGAVSRMNLDYRKDLEKALPDHKICIEKLFGPKLDVKPRKADLTVVGTDILIDLDPTISHNSTIGYRCYKGFCNAEDPSDHSNCHEEKDPHYQEDRWRAAQGDGWRLIQFYDWDDKSRSINYIKNLVEENFIDLCGLETSLVNGDHVDSNRSVGLVNVEEFISRNSIHSTSIIGDAADHDWLVFYDRTGGIKAVCKMARAGDQIIIRDFITKDQRPVSNAIRSLVQTFESDGHTGELVVERDLDLNLPVVDKNEESLIGAIDFRAELVWAHPTAKKRNRPVPDEMIQSSDPKIYAENVKQLMDRGMTRMYTAGVEILHVDLAE